MQKPNNYDETPAGGIILIFIIFNIDTYSSFTEIEISTLILVITICSCTGIIVNKLNEINKK